MPPLSCLTNYSIVFSDVTDGCLNIGPKLTSLLQSNRKKTRGQSVLSTVIICVYRLVKTLIVVLENTRTKIKLSVNLTILFESS